MSAKIAIDTNLLLVLLADEHLRKRGINTGLRWMSTLRDVWGQGGDLPTDGFHALRQVFRQARERIVTPHVLVEVYNLRRRLDVQDPNILTGLLAGLSLSEHPCSFADLNERDEYRKILGDVGITDAGLVYVAETARATILSDDSKLLNWARIRRVPCSDLNKLSAR